MSYSVRRSQRGDEAQHRVSLGCQGLCMPLVCIAGHYDTFTPQKSPRIDRKKIDNEEEVL